MTTTPLSRVFLGFALLAAFSLAAAPPVLAQGGAPIPVVQGPSIEVTQTPRAPGRDGSLVFHGNYCGPGSRGAGLAPVDALDAACMHHDACSPPPGGIPSCACHDRLTVEARTIALDASQPDDLRMTAEFVAGASRLMACQR